MNSLFFPRFSSQDILLLLFVVFKYIVDCIHRLHVVFQFPSLLGNTFLGVSRRRRHVSEVPKSHKNKFLSSFAWVKTVVNVYSVNNFVEHQRVKTRLKQSIVERTQFDQSIIIKSAEIVGSPQTTLLVTTKLLKK